MTFLVSRRIKSKRVKKDVAAAEPIAEEDGGSLSPNNTPTWKPYLLKKSNDLKDMMLPSSYRSGSREDVRSMTSLH